MGDQPQFLTIIDLDQDGALDIAVANQSFSISVLLGSGDGTFRPERRFAVETEPFARVAQPAWLEVDDLNADGLLDIVTVNDGSNDASVLLGDGRGEFTLLLQLPVGIAPTSGALADLNGDGQLDLATSNSASRDLSVLLGAGDGTFQNQQRFATGSGPHFVRVVDLNGDNAPDLITPGALLLHE